MTSTPSPTWYDVLGVSRDARPEEIKAAWRQATDRFEPGSASGQFRMFNEAADVLLDPERRAAYDRTLEPVPATAPASAPSTPSTPPPPAGPAGSTVAADSPAAVAAEPPAGRPAGSRSRRLLPERGTAASGRALAALAVLAVLTIAALVVAGIFAGKARGDARIADAREQAPAAAEQAAKALFAYDYRHLPEDRKRAENYMTSSFAAKYDKNFQQLEKQKDGAPGLAVQTKTVVTSTVQGSGVVDAEQGLARVLVYVNQTSQKAGKDPQVFQNRVAMTMKQSGDRWLVDDVKSY